MQLISCLTCMWNLCFDPTWNKFSALSTTRLTDSRLATTLLHHHRLSSVFHDNLIFVNIFSRILRTVLQHFDIRYIISRETRHIFWPIFPVTIDCRIIFVFFCVPFQLVKKSSWKRIFIFKILTDILWSEYCFFGSCRWQFIRLQSPHITSKFECCYMTPYCFSDDEVRFAHSP